MTEETPPKKSGRLARLILAGQLEQTPPPARPKGELERALRRAARNIQESRVVDTGEFFSLETVVAGLTDAPILSREATDRGRVTSLTWRYPLSSLHGNRRHDEALALPCDLIATILRDERLVDFDVRHAMFVDIESTGLSHGAGTYAFLIGLAWFESDELVVQELFMEDPSDEAAMLARFAQLRASRPFLVSFNGRCYDVHVLQSRLVLNRVYDEAESELLLTPHVDLLHLSRSMYRGVFENGRLQTLEKEVLAIARHGDVPGELIPSLYFAYLSNTNVGPLAPVFRHNAVDVLSMVSLLSHLGEILAEDPPALAPQIAANLGATWLNRKDPVRAVRALSSAAERLGADERVAARKRQVVALKRSLDAEVPGIDVDRLVRALEDWCLLRPSSSLPHIELSMAHERRTRDFVAAHRHALSALQRLPESCTDEERLSAERRVARLARRL